MRGEPFDIAAAADDWPACPSRFLDSLRMYVEQCIPTGGFLRAVLENNLEDAVARADAEALSAIRAIAGVVYNHTPSLCHGSPAKVSAWLKRRENA